MTATEKRHDLGGSIWLDYIARDLLNNGSSRVHIGGLFVTGLTSNPRIFDHAIDLQRLTMESNGQHVTLSGTPVDYDTCLIYWGEPGTNDQHSFYQRIHQGTRLVPSDFVGFAQALDPPGRHHDILQGNRPPKTLLPDQLPPTALGMLVALYEHNAFTQGVTWQIGSSDQWGVEPGKIPAQQIIPQPEPATDPSVKHDNSTNTPIPHYRTLKGAAQHE